MRFKHTPYPVKGDRRTVKKFIWFPKTIDLETRWLEKAQWCEEFRDFRVTSGWRPIHWLNS